MGVEESGEQAEWVWQSAKNIAVPFSDGAGHFFFFLWKKDFSSPPSVPVGASSPMASA